MSSQYSAIPCLAQRIAGGWNGAGPADDDLVLAGVLGDEKA